MLIDFEKRTLYWTKREPGGVLRADLDGTDIDGTTLTPIVDGLDISIGISMDRENRRLYYADAIISPPSGYIWESDMDGNNARVILETVKPLGISFVPE